MSPVSLDDSYPSMKMGSNCLLIQKNDKNVLIDTGTGLFNPDENKYKIDYPRKLLTGLKDLNITPSDIDIVILTHFHFDHCGGCISEDKEPVFSNAVHYLQSSEIEFAEKDPTLYKYWSVFKDILGKYNLLKIIDGNFNLEKSVKLMLSPGHTAGLQYAKFTINDQNYIFPGDIIPTLWHLNNENIIYLDYDPEALKTAKRNIINDCIEDDSVMIFQHSVRPMMGKLINKGSKIGFQRIYC
ncbi:MAG: MBL fold metallo-hydrolase [Candidatus Delongbacteria bacterium]|nr:MBL fold metallo-hydrolase [Candidatus Delongbacteria bacterium]